MSTIEQVLDELAQLHPKLIDLGLDRTFEILETLGNPHLHLPPVIHIAGTNGKGSTAAFIRAMANEAACGAMSTALRICAVFMSAFV